MIAEVRSLLKIQKHRRRRLSMHPARAGVAKGGKRKGGYAQKERKGLQGSKKRKDGRDSKKEHRHGGQLNSWTLLTYLAD